MSTEGNNVEETLSSNPISPRNRVKFLCSHGGKILPRPADGHLKYVGGETRVISVPRDIAFHCFQELMKKLTYLIDGEMILKYELVPEELDALVSVKSDEDLSHMFKECDRHGTAKFPRLRAFLLPAAPVVMENQIGTMEPHAFEQRYIDAINGIIRTSAGTKQHPAVNITRQSSLVSLACSSPRSEDSYTAETINSETMIWGNYRNGRSNLHKVRSSPNKCSHARHNSNHVHQHSHRNYHNYSQPHHPCCQYPKLPVDLSRNGVPERLISVRSVGRVERIRYQTDHAPQDYYSASRQNRGSRCCTKCMHYEECNPCSDIRTVDRTGSPTMSPLSLSPQHGASRMKAWDSIIAGDRN